MKQYPELDVILVGVVNERQLSNNIYAFRITQSSILDFSQFAIKREDMINPNLWKLT